MKLITTLLIASTLAANANWFTELFETEAQRQARYEGTEEQRQWMAEACRKSPSWNMDPATFDRIITLEEELNDEASGRNDPWYNN